MIKINYIFLETELTENMLENLQNEDKNKEIICEQISILAAFGMMNAEQIRQLSYFKHYDDYRCYATYFYAIQNQYLESEMFQARCQTIADDLVELEKQENNVARQSFSDDAFRAVAPKNRDRSNDISMIFMLSHHLLYTINDYFISKEFIDDDCIVSRKKAINTVRRKILNQILQIDPAEISNRAYRYSLKKFENQFTKNGVITDNLKLFIYRSNEKNAYQSFIDMILSDAIEDTEFNRARLQELVQVLVILRRINTAQVIQLCAQSLNKPRLLPISMLIIEAAMNTSLNIQLELEQIDDLKFNETFSLEDFEATASKPLDQIQELGFYEFAFNLLEHDFVQRLDFKREHEETFDLATYFRLFTLFHARKLSIKDYAKLKLDFDF